LPWKVSLLSCRSCKQFAQSATASGQWWLSFPLRPLVGPDTDRPTRHFLFLSASAQWWRGVVHLSGRCESWKSCTSAVVRLTSTKYASRWLGTTVRLIAVRM
jgi:hypothetical protein